jgi:hypothetical protein
VELSENNALRALIDGHPFYQHTSPVLHQFGIGKYQSFTPAYRFLSVFLNNHAISLRLSLVVYLGISCYFCLALELLLEHAFLMFVEI